MKDKPYILVVDDDPNISRLEQLYLEKEGYEVKVAADGNEAIESFRKLPPDLVLLDVMLPGTDGYEVLKAIRKSGSIPVIMVTAKGETFDKVLCLELGADDYIVKPFDGKEMIARVKAVLRRAHGSEEEQAGDLVFQRIIRTPGRYTYVTVVYCLMMAVMIGGLVLLTRKGGKAETIVFALAVAIGMLYMLVMIPLSIPDEQVHYQASYRLSSVMMFQKDKMDSGERAYFDYHGLGGHYNMGSGYDRIAEEITSPKAEISGTRKLTQRLDYPLMYVPQAIGITIGRIFGANFIILFWLGRLMNLLFYAALLYFAVKTTPKFGVLLSLVGLMPMALHQAASYSYDAFINGMALLLIALMMRATERKGRMEVKEYLQILAVGMLMSPAKAVYTPMLALLLFIPKERFGSGKRKMLMICYIWAASLAAVAVFQLGGIRNAMTSGGGDTNWEGNANYTLGYLVSHPGETAQLFVGSLRANLTEWPYQAIGNRLSGLSMEVTGWKITVYAVLLCLASQTAKGNETQVTGRERAAYLLVSAAVVFLVMLTMLLNWTSQNDTMIQGIQGRYFIPIVPLLLMCLNNRMIRLNINPERILLTGAIAIHLAVLSGVMRMTVLV